MAQYTLLDPLTGVSRILSENRLTRNLQFNVILFQGEEHVGIITHRDIVLFCRWCAGQVLSGCQTVPPNAQAALALVDRWLIDPGTVSSDEMYAAAEAAQLAGARLVGSAALASWAFGFATDVACAASAADISYEVQAQWLIEHLKSNQ